MGRSRRLIDQECRQIVRERAKGVSVSAISRGLQVLPKAVCNILDLGRSAGSAYDSCTRVLTMRITDRDPRATVLGTQRPRQAAGEARGEPWRYFGGLFSGLAGRYARHQDGNRKVGALA
jgi:hypothetical protein